MAFSFQNQVTYEQLLIFAKDIFAFTGKLPSYESNGLILRIRNLASSLLQEYALGSTRVSKVNFSQAVEKCIVLVAQIVSLSDLCVHLGYATLTAQRSLILSAEDITKRLYQLRKP
ncbi:hypothetical protein A2379_05135 [Candidatus Amesbacteria bacterium RIFOXYB1_FULL_47_13]|nr:MAG: hypothetical protein A2379_05135 [Candidatus Amesbacteria bacterium RIFOXYB1_FULL_47_13]HBC72491.1 hypothetical protein [Candidatus Amesbacteria bacterium]